jgi:predicted MFS family arabinose efflux permease
MLSSAVSIAVITHKVSILNEIGISRAAAAQIAATAGIASVTGKLLTGWLYDRFRSSWIGFVAFALMAVGFLGLLEPLHTRALIVTAMLLFGYSSGAMLQAAMYLTAQYGGLRNFGKIFGVNTSIVSIGIGTGPILGGLIRDHLGSYRPLFALGILIGLLSGLMVTGLGTYPRWETSPH